MLQIEIESADGSKKLLQAPDECVIGKGAQSEVHLEGWRVAKEHARLLTTPAGVLLHAETAVVPPGASRNYQLSAAPFSYTGGPGTLEVAHDGPPGALVGNVTTINFGAGVSFDTPLVPRMDYQ